MKYPFIAYQTQVEGHIFWVAECLTLKGCVGQGDTLESACKELEENETEWLKTAEKYNIEIPPIPMKNKPAIKCNFIKKIFGLFQPPFHKTLPRGVVKGEKPSTPNPFIRPSSNTK